MHASIRIAIALMVGVALASLSTSSGLPIVWGLALFLSAFLPGTSRGRLGVTVVLIGGLTYALHDWQQIAVERAHRAELDDREGELLEGYVEGLPALWPQRQQLLLQTQDARVLLTIYHEGSAGQVELVPGQKIRIYARLKKPVGLRGKGASNRRLAVMAMGGDLIASASSEDLHILDEASWSLWRVPTLMHRWAVQRIGGPGRSKDGLAIVTALTTGDRSKMSEPLLAAVRATGVAHLLAVSGMHLATVVALVFFFVRRSWAFTPWSVVFEPRSMAAGVALLAALLFTAMTGARASTCRALLVASFVLVGMILDRRIQLLHALAWAASLLLLWNPALLWDPGFQLSFAASTALALAFGRPQQALEFASTTFAARLYRGLKALALASFWATLATAPFAMYHFGAVAWIGLASNLLAVPFTTLVLLPTALAGLVLCLIWPAAGHLVVDLACSLAQLLAQLCYLVESRLPLQIRSPLNLLESLCWALLLVTLLAPGLWRSKRIRHLLQILLLAVFILSRYFAVPWQAQPLRVTFVEIGQGDAAVIELPGGDVWLVDGGGLPFVGPAASAQLRQHIAEAPARQALLPYLRHRRIDHVDLVIVSHPHPDHYVGLQAVARAMPIVELWSAHSPSQEPGAYELWLAALETSGTRVLSPSVGLARTRGGVTLDVLWPRYSEPNSAVGAQKAKPDPILSVNDNSLVLRLGYAGRRFLFAGDIEEEAEQLLSEDYGDEIRADLVKVPHHGSPTSSTQLFVDATQAAIAIISCGRGNSFGFPDSDVVRRWSSQADLVLRTDLVGSVSVQVWATGKMKVQSAAPF